YLSGASRRGVLPGLHAALRTREGREDLVLVEGVFDVVLLQAGGFQNVAALGGASLSPETLEAPGRAGRRPGTRPMDYDPKADGSSPGLEGTRKAVENAYKGNNVPVVYAVHPEELRKVAGTPEGEKVDPDSLVRAKGMEAFREVLTKAEPGGLLL